MKAIAKKLLQSTLLRSRDVEHCSQTVYEALLACTRMHDATGSELWRQRSDEVLEILLSIQQPDGGFDIGYEFHFGRLHRKGESTSPELVSLIALCEYGQRFGFERVRQPARRAAEWIRSNAIEREGGQWVIPYAPYSVREVMVYNGTSFAAAALGAYLAGVEGSDENEAELRAIYAGMLVYLESSMSRDDTLPGRFWFYSDQTRTDMDDVRRSKIDYYHQMQQVEVHALAEQRTSTARQLELIRDAADHVVGLQDVHEVVPYTESVGHFGGLIHTWGFSSVAAGMLEAARLVPDRRDAYHAVARRVLGWLVEHAWTGKRFHAVLTPKGQPVLDEYMVRSDAWVLNAMAAGCAHLGEGPWSDVVEPCFATMQGVNFSGPESHASTAVKRGTLKSIQFVIDRLPKRLFAR